MSIFDSSEVKDTLKHHYRNCILTWVAWIGLSLMVCYFRYTQTKPEQRNLVPYEILLTLICVFNLEINQKIARKVKELRAREDVGEANKSLALEFKNYYAEMFKYKAIGGFCYFLSVGISTPDMLKECIEGKLPWKDLVAFLVFLAFVGTLSGMIVMSLNYPFMIHSATYTFSGIFLLSIYCYEKKIETRLKKWADNVNQS